MSCKHSDDEDGAKLVALTGVSPNPTSVYVYVKPDENIIACRDRYVEGFFAATMATSSQAWITDVEDTQVFAFSVSF